MVHHAKDLPRIAGNQEPSTYVKVYLLPDHNKATKRKTKVVKKNCYPSFMEMVNNNFKNYFYFNDVEFCNNFYDYFN